MPSPRPQETPVQTPAPFAPKRSRTANQPAHIQVIEGANRPSAVPAIAPIDPLIACGERYIELWTLDCSALAAAPEISDDFYQTLAPKIWAAQKQLAKTPAISVDGLLAKLRFLAASISDSLEEPVPTMATAYAFESSECLGAVIASAWADAERLFGAAAHGDFAAADRAINPSLMIASEADARAIMSAAE